MAPMTDTAGLGLALVAGAVTDLFAWCAAVIAR